MKITLLSQSRRSQVPSATAHARVDYCNAVLTAAMKSTTDKLQRALTARFLMPRLHQDTMFADTGYIHLYPLVALNMYLVSAIKLSPVCRPSVAGYKWIQVDRDINE